MPAIIAQISAAGPHLFAAVRLSLWCVALVMTWTAIERLRDAYTHRALPRGNSAVRLQGEHAVAADALRLGAMAAFAASESFDIMLVTALSCSAGVLAAMARTQMSWAAIRSALMNSLAIWIAAFVLALETHADLGMALGIGLGVGLAGTEALEMFKRGAVALARRIAGAPPVKPDDPVV